MMNLVQILLIFLAVLIIACLVAAGISSRPKLHIGAAEKDRPMRSLELGFGDFIDSPPGYHVTAVDKAPAKRKDIKYASEPPKLLNIRQGDMEEFVKSEAAQGQKYDRIYMSFSWHYVKHPGEMLNGLKRLLAAGGNIRIAEPNGEKFHYSHLNKGSPDFSQMAHDRKMEIINRAKKPLMELGSVLFNIEEESLPAANVYILTHKA